MITKEGKIIINEWDKGIGSSSARGFADMRNCDPFRKPGYLELAPELVNEADTPFSYTFTAVAATDIVTTSGNITRAEGSYSGALKAVQFTTTGTLPAGLSLATNYFITADVNLDATHFKLSSTVALADAGTSDIDITDTGTGTHTATTVNMGTPRYIVNDLTYGLFLQDSNGKIWNRTSSFFVLYVGNTLTSAQGNGLAIWQGYLIAFRNQAIDVALLSSKTWTNSFKTSMTSIADHFPFVSGDGILYFSNGTIVGSLVENTTFDPASAPTYTYNDSALDLEDTITCFGDLGDKLMIGTNVNKIYPWDRTSSSFDKPIMLLEYNVPCMKSLNNVLYFSAGVRGNIYRTYGTTAESFIDLSDEFSNTLRYTAVTSAIMLTSNEMFFYVLGNNQSISGIYSANLITGAYHLKYKFSQGYTVLPYKNAVVSRPISTNTDIIIGAYLIPESGIAYIDTTFFFGSSFSMATRYISYVITQLYEVGTFTKPRTFQTMQIILAAEMSSGMGIKVSSRKNLTDAFAETATFDYTTIGDATAWESPINIEKAQFIQFKIELQRSGSAPNLISSYWDTPTIKTLIID